MKHAPHKKPHWSFGHRLPHGVAAPLFGDRKRYGCDIQPDDPDWKGWSEYTLQFYEKTQQQGVGQIVNRAGYSILGATDLNGKRVMEIGPGILPHRSFWKGVPRSYALLDDNPDFLKQSENLLRQQSIKGDAFTLSGPHFPFENEFFDVIIAFYVLEHLHPLDDYLREIKRVLRPGGILIGAIPAEGGLSWGIGRFLTARRYAKKNIPFNYDKVICWSHPNFADQILNALQDHFYPEIFRYWPFYLPLIDLNLVVSFLCRK